MEINIYDVIDSAMANNFKTVMDSARGPVTIAINSAGGSTFHGFSMYNNLAAYGSHTTARIDGVAASMATVLACATKHVSMASNAWFMIHNAWMITAGDSNHLRGAINILDKTKDEMVAAYVKKTGLPEAEISKMMDDETWMNAEEALAKGFVDEIFDASGEEQALASGTAEIFAQLRNVPSALSAKLTINQPKKNTDHQKAATELKKTAGEFSAAYDRNEVFSLDEISSLIIKSGGSQQGFGELVDIFRIASQSNLSAAQLQDIKNDYLSGSIGINQFQKRVNDMTYHVSNGNLVSDSLRASLGARLGHQDAESDNRYQGMPLFELARASLQDRGISLAGKTIMEIAATAFTHSASDFGSILIEAANKSMLRGWDESPETFDKWVRAGNLPDFRTGHRVGLEAFPTLREVRPGAEYKYVTLDDRGEKIVLATYGELFSITREAIINDDLGVIDTIPAAMARAAKATVGDLIYAVLTGNPEMSDGVPLFDTDHGNFISGALGIDTLSDGRATMRLQRSTSGRILNIAPEFLIVPVAQETIADQLINSISVPGSENNSAVANPFYNKLTVIPEPRLDEHSEDEWYLSAAKGRDTIEVAYLGGKARPHLEAQSGFTVDGVAMKVRIDAGVAPMDHRGMIKSSGV